MPKIEILNGSPRKKGNTSSLIEIFEQGIDKSKFSSHISFLYDYSIQPCTDCRACKVGNLVGTVKDDMQELYKRIKIADIIVFGTPIYWFGPTATMKLLIDRLRPYYGNKGLTGKKAALILPAGVGEKDCDLTIEMFRRMTNSLGIELIGTITSKAYDIGESKNDKDAIESINNLLDNINQTKVYIK